MRHEIVIRSQRSSEQCTQKEIKEYAHIQTHLHAYIPVFLQIHKTHFNVSRHPYISQKLFLCKAKPLLVTVHDLQKVFIFVLLLTPTVETTCVPSASRQRPLCVYALHFYCSCFNKGKSVFTIGPGVVVIVVFMLLLLLAVAWERLWYDFTLCGDGEVMGKGVKESKGLKRRMRWLSLMVLLVVSVVFVAGGDCWTQNLFVRFFRTKFVDWVEWTIQRLLYCYVVIQICELCELYWSLVCISL